MQTQCSTNTRLSEQAGYFTVPGAHLYTVVHQVTDPVARVLLVGPFASERHVSYHPWVRWARYLAARQIEVVRYDYRGVGESTGVFEEMSFEHWSEDVQLLPTGLYVARPVCRSCFMDLSLALSSRVGVSIAARVTLCCFGLLLLMQTRHSARTFCTGLAWNSCTSLQRTGGPLLTISAS